MGPRAVSRAVAPWSGSGIERVLLLAAALPVAALGARERVGARLALAARAALVAVVAVGWRGGPRLGGVRGHLGLVGTAALVGGHGGARLHHRVGQRAADQ